MNRYIYIERERDRERGRGKENLDRLSFEKKLFILSCFFRSKSKRTKILKQMEKEREGERG